MNAPHATSQHQWRTVDELTGADERASATGEFAPGASEWDGKMNRRHFLELMGASLALAGGACTRLPHEEIVPYVHPPELSTPGHRLYFATSMDLGGMGYGMLVRSNEGRPTKMEGNPLHPASLGRSSIHMQAELLSLYDPARSKTVLKDGHPESWEELLGELSKKAAEWKSDGGKGLRLLTRRIGSPTLQAQIGKLLARFPLAKWHVHDAAFPASPLPARVNLDEAEVILSLDADLFGTGGAQLPLASSFAKRRQPGKGMNRLYAVEVTPTLTGAMADHRLALAPSVIVTFAQTLADAIRSDTKMDDLWAGPLVRDLSRHRGRSVVVAGAFMPPSVHAAAQAMNVALGNVGKTIEYPSSSADPVALSIAELTGAMDRGEVQSLFILSNNPVYEAAADLDFARALVNVPLTLHLGLHADETAARCRWHVPASHFLETWSDTSAFDGSASIVQPLIAPLYPTHSAHELLACLLEEVPTTDYEIVRAAWRERHPDVYFEPFWRRTLHDGGAPTPTPGSHAFASALDGVGARSLTDPLEGMELVIRADPYLLDGRYAENAWLQELPKPFTQLTWENAAHISPRTCSDLKLKHGDVVKLRYRGRSVRAPVWMLPGQADGCVTIHLGYGRRNAGEAGATRGFNASLLQTSDAPSGGSGLEIRKTSERHTFATTQTHQRMEGRDPVRIVTAEGPPNTSAFDAETPSADDSLFPTITYGRPAWGMVIDLNTCIGCSACTIACQAENNIPTVGRDQVLRGRHMHWIRVDRYYAGSPDAPQMLHQPVPCMHCENAPCEVVCPVAATVHDHEGLNVMVYNRCIGTRYCSNNCPYKVRRFNFLQFVDNDAATLRLMRNPEVTVRMRGVMEKCTYCVQRISAARIEAEKENRPIRDGEVTPACAQACPADAIVFGDIHDPESRVAALRKSPRNYSLLGELNARPRTTYLARVRNPNPEIG